MRKIAKSIDKIFPEEIKKFRSCMPYSENERDQSDFLLMTDTVKCRRNPDGNSTRCKAPDEKA